MTYTEMELAFYFSAVAKADTSPDDFAYAPDREKPTTWKLPLVDSSGKMTARQVGMAVAALGLGFRGQKVQIPTEDLPAVKRKVLVAWKKVNLTAKPEDVPEVLKSIAGPTSASIGGPMDLNDVTKQLSEMEGQLAELTKRAERAEAVAKIAPEMRKCFDGLSKEQQDEFLKADSEGRMKMCPMPMQKSDEEEEVPEPVQKRMDEMKAEFQKSMDAANARAQAAEEVAKRERDSRERAEFAKRAETELPNLPGTAVEKGEALRAIHSKLSSEECDTVTKLLQAGNAALQQLGVPVGKDGGTEKGDSWERIEKRAVAFAADQKLTIGKAQAVDVFLRTEEGSRAYSEYLKEQGQQ